MAICNIAGAYKNISNISVVTGISTSVQTKLTCSAGFFVSFGCKHIAMVSKVSEGIEISVETFYQPDYSNPLQSEFMFAYRISIENKNSFPVKLHRRHWQIFDSNGQNREVEGEGVVGVQPTLNPGEKYQYVSGCNLRTEMGRMIGSYQMENLSTKKIFDVAIPSFEMVVPFKNN
jgi:ApaG protein